MAADLPERTRLLGSRFGRRSAATAQPAVSVLPHELPATDTGRQGPMLGSWDVSVAPDSFEAVFEAHYERLVRALTVVAGDRDLAADAVQDAFVKAHLRWNKISGYDDPSAWVRRVAINRLRDEHRRSRRKWRAVQRLGSHPAPTNEPPEIDDFGRLLRRLPRQQRLVTALYYVDGLSVAEIAATLDISEGTVKSHLHDARRRLRPILEHEVNHD